MIDKGYIAIIGSLGVRSLSLALLVVILARALGTSAYGAYAAAVSLAGFFATFSGFGAATLHVRNVSRGALHQRDSLRRSVGMICWVMPLLAIFAMGLSWAVIPSVVPMPAVLMLVLGELLAAAATDMFKRVYQAQSRFISMGLAICAIPATRVAIAISYLAVVGRIGFADWAYISFISGGSAFVILIWAGLLSQYTGGAGIRIRQSWRDTLSGLSFALSTASSRIHGDADKVVLARIVGASVAGEYTIAYRLTSVLTLPVLAGVERLLPTLFRKGANGFVYTAKASFSRVIVAFFGALLLSIAVYLIAPVLPRLVGADYSASVHIARSLALIPLTLTVWVVVRSLAATSGYEHAMGMTELMGAVFNVAGCTVAVLIWGWIGAVYVSYATHIAMSIGLVSWVLCAERSRVLCT